MRNLVARFHAIELSGIVKYIIFLMYLEGYGWYIYFFFIADNSNASKTRRYLNNKHKNPFFFYFNERKAIVRYKQ